MDLTTWLRTTPNGRQSRNLGCRPGAANDPEFITRGSRVAGVHVLVADAEVDGFDPLVVADVRVAATAARPDQWRAGIDADHI